MKGLTNFMHKKKGASTNETPCLKSKLAKKERIE